MSDFDSNYLFNILNNININPQNLKTATNYIYYHRENNKENIFNIWKQLFFSPIDNVKCLYLFIIIHEIILISALKSKYDYIYLISPLLKSIIKYLSLKISDIKYLLKINEIINVWQELLIFSTDYIEEMKKIIKNKVRL